MQQLHRAKQTEGATEQPTSEQPAEAESAPTPAVEPISIEPHGTGHFLVRTERGGVFADEGLGGRWDEQAGGYVFSNLRRGTIEAKVEELNAQQGAADADTRAELPASTELPQAVEQVAQSAPAETGIEGGAGVGNPEQARVERVARMLKLRHRAAIYGGTESKGRVGRLEEAAGKLMTDEEAGVAEEGPGWVYRQNEPVKQIQPSATEPPKVQPKRKPKQPTLQEKRLLDYYDAFNSEADQASAEHQVLEESGGFGRVFRQDKGTKSGFPRELEDQFTPEEMAQLKQRGIIRHSDPSRNLLGSDPATGADALAEMGADRYADMLRRQLEGSGAGKLRKAIEFAKGGDDPEMAFLAAELETRPADDVTPRKVLVNPAELRVGDKGTINKLPVEVVEENGVKVLRDDGDIPDTPLDALGKVPLDKGSLVREKRQGNIAENITEPPVPKGMVRFYHGGVPGEGPRDVTPDRAYAEGYAFKNVNEGGNVVQYIDVPENHPLLSKSFDDTGSDVKSPYNSFKATAEMMRGAKRLNPGTGAKSDTAKKPNSAPVPGKPSLIESLDAAESAAKARLKQRFTSAEAKAQRAARGKRRGGGAADPLFDPDTLRDLVIIGGAKLAKLGIKAAQLGKQVFHLTTEAGKKLFKQWAEAMRKDPDVSAIAGEMTDTHLKRVWIEARRTGQMSEDELAQWALAGKVIQSEETTKQTVRRTTGQTKDMASAQTQLGLLRAVFKAQAKGAREGYVAGKRDTTALREELANTLADFLPPEQAGKLLDEVASADTAIKVGHVMSKAEDIVADAAVKEGLERVTKLLGNVVEMPVRRPSDLSGKPKAPKLTDLESIPLRQIDLNRIDPGSGAREELKKLKARAANVKAVLQSAKTNDQKYEAVAELNRIERGVRQIVADDNAAKEIRVGDHNKTRDEIVGGMLKVLRSGEEGGQAVGTGPGVASSKPPAEPGLLRKLGRTQLSMETIVGHLFGEDSDAYKLTIDRVREGQAGFEGERQKSDKVMRAAYDAAGLKNEVQRDRWLNQRVTVKLNRDRSVEMTRDQMLSVVATASDPQTKLLIEAGIGQNFGTNPRAKPTIYTPREIEHMKGLLTPGELGIVEAFQRRVKEMWPDAAAAKMDLSGYAPEPHEGYFPRRRNLKQSEEAALPSGWRGHVNKAIENISNMEERAQDVGLPLLVKGFTETVFENLDETAKLIHLAEAARSVAAVWEHPEITGAIAQRFGDSMNKRVEGFLLDTMMARQHPPRNLAEKTSTFLMRNQARKYLAINPSPWSKNVVGGSISTFSSFELQDWLHGVRNMFKPSTYKRMIEQSPIAWSIYEGGGLYGQYSPLLDRHVETVSQLHTLPALKLAFRALMRGDFKDWYQKTGAAIDALPMMAWADSIPRRLSFAAAEHFVERTQPSLTGEAKQQAVLKKFHDVMYSTQNGTSSTEISGMSSEVRKHPLLQPLLMFKSDQNKKFNMLARMKGKSATEKSKVLLSVALNALSSAGISAGLALGAVKLGQKLGHDLDNPAEDDKRENAALWGIAREVAGMQFWGDNVVDLTRGVVSGKSPNLRDPVDDELAGVAEGFVKLGHGLHQWSQTHADTPQRQTAYDQMTKALGNLLQSGLGLAGDPTVPLRKLGMRAYHAGTDTPKFASKDVDWIKERARTLGDAQAVPLRSIRELEKQFSEAKSRPEQAELSKRIDAYASAVRADYELPDVKRAMTLADQVKVDDGFAHIGSPEMRLLQKAIHEHAMAATIQERRAAADAVAQAAKEAIEHYTKDAADIAEMHQNRKKNTENRSRERLMPAAR